MSIINRIKYGLIRDIIGNDEAVVFFQRKGEGGGFIQVEDEPGDSGLKGAVKCLIENTDEIHDFLLDVVADYLKKNESERLKFSKRIYNE